MPSAKKKIKKVTESKNKNKNKNKVNVVVNVNSKNKNKSTSNKSGGGGGFGGGSNTVVNNVPYPVFMPPQNHAPLTHSVPQVHIQGHGLQHQGSASQASHHAASTAAQTEIFNTPSTGNAFNTPEMPNLVSRVRFAPSVLDSPLLTPPHSHRSTLRIEEIGSRIHPQHFTSVNTPGGALTLSEMARDRPRSTIPARSQSFSGPISQFVIPANMQSASRNVIPEFNLDGDSQRGFGSDFSSTSHRSRETPRILPSEIQEQPKIPIVTRSQALQLEAKDPGQSSTNPAREPSLPVKVLNRILTNVKKLVTPKKRREYDLPRIPSPLTASKAPPKAAITRAQATINRNADLARAQSENNLAELARAAKNTAQGKRRDSRTTGQKDVNKAQDKQSFLTRTIAKKK